MENLLIYFLKANGLIILFYLMYVIFLRKETFFTSNRWYLIGGLVLSLILPLITFTKTIWVEPTPIPVIYEEIISANNNAIEVPIQETTLDWTLILITVYTVISILLLMKITFELASFFNRIRKNEKQKEINFVLIHSDTTENPFSFFHYIVINPNRFSKEEFQHILTHESIHVKQKHSIDVLLAKLFCAFFWANPIVWLYRKAILQNLEFIADSETFQQIENKYEYQKTLLKVVTHQHNLSITNQFYQSLIKKRIVMLHTNQSNKKNVWKYATILPLLVGFMLFFQIETVAQVKENPQKAHAVKVEAIGFSWDKNATDAEMKSDSEQLKKQGIVYTFSNVKRNKNGEIIAIKIEFNDGKGNKGIKEIKGDEPIEPIYFSAEEGKIGFTAEPDYSDYVVDEKLSKQFGTEIKVKMVINGKLQSENEKIKIPLDQELDVLKELDEKELKSKYNIDKKESEIYFELTTKEISNSPNSDAVYAVEVAAEYSEDETFSRIDNIKRNKLVDAKKALILLNGKEINYQDLDKIDEKTISSSGNMVASHAMKKYGEKGKNGVIFINTKAYDIENNPIIRENLISKNNPDKTKPRFITLKNGDNVVVVDGDKIKFPGYPTHYLNQLKLELKGKILEDNIDFLKNYDFEKIKDLIIIEDEMSPKEKKRIKKIIIETK